VSLIDNTKAPIASWLFINAYPVKWSVSDLDATNNSVVIEHMELTYQRMQSIRL
jgi:phage tail-like protein